MAETGNDLAKQRESSYQIHKFLRAEGAGPWELGGRYSYEIRLGIWPSQRALAMAFSISVSHVSRCIAISQLSKRVVDACGGSDNLSFRLGKKLLSILKKIGKAEMERRAIYAERLGLTSFEDLLEVFSSDVLSTLIKISTRINVSVSDDGSSLSIHGRDAKNLIPHISRLEGMINEFLASIPENKARKRRDKAKKLRRTRMRSASGGLDVS
ncbi:hypothetical protein F4827_003834 [Paraburkholderia bannensis]|uniref:Uncharacterized protein n=1 Tax=Paraburkholderia bannensis TaxID=765414 RepID=A0A7W9WTU8_9BURK|nr:MULTISPECIES: hypothetical protein [Paraburkholderia]MBB3258965.1 hypothetical protein [Paraburkholderia sp. WP4_3_2]MBB6103979.1 hypothetical protein [Paraburkholderia bannensis]